MVVFWSRCQITLSQRCHNVAFLTSLLQPKTNVVTTLCFRRRFSYLVTTLQQRRDSENLNVFQYHYNFLFPRICNIALQFYFLINKIYYVCVNAKHSLKWWIFENLDFVAWTEKRDFWSCVVHWSETAPCFLAVNSVGSWFNYFLRSIKSRGIISICYDDHIKPFEFILI